MEREFLNRDEVCEVFLNLLKEVVENYGYDYGMCEDFVVESAFYKTEETLSSMKRYVHQKNTRMDGNFCNIREDWEYCYEFIGSEVKPWGKFDDVIKSIDDGTISDEKLKDFQTWALDWFFRAFGTWGLKYNFGEELTSFMDELEEEEEIAA